MPIGEPLQIFTLADILLNVESPVEGFTYVVTYISAMIVPNTKSKMAVFLKYDLIFYPC